MVFRVVIARKDKRAKGKFEFENYIRNAEPLIHRTNDTVELIIEIEK